MLRVAIQGQEGSFHHAVTARQFDKYELICCDTFHEVFESVESGKADVAITAIENSLYGSIADVYDLLLKYKLPIVGELVEHIHLQLMTKPGVVLRDITEVYSHPVALNQCRKWLETHLPDAEIIEHHDTAGAVAYVKQLDSPFAAAIAGSQASKLYHLPILVSDIEDEKTNLTRFLILATTAPTKPSGHKASLVLTTSHAPGALHQALGVFAARNINLTKLTSRPIRGERFRYQFFIDAECDEAQLDAITTELEAQDCTVRLLGHYHKVSS